MGDDVFLDEGALTLNDPPKLVWVKAQDAVGLLWRENPKLHDMQTLVESIRRHGFQTPGKFDGKLFRVGQKAEAKKPSGAIKAGNGRYEAVAWIEAQWEQIKADEEGMPRGLAMDADGAWCVPILVGTDAKSTSAAMEFAIDDNNMVMSGGDLDGFDMARMWDAHYVELVGGLDELPVSVDADMVAALTSMFDVPDLSDLEDEFGEPGEDDFWPIIRVKVRPDTYARYEELMAKVPVEDETEKFTLLIAAVDEVILLSGSPT